MHAGGSILPKVVGVVYSRETLAAATALPAAGPPDWIELRADAFARQPEALDGWQPPRPLLVTARHPAEGGLDGSLKAMARRGLYERFLVGATGIDVEVRSLGELSGLVQQARGRSCIVIGSFHDFTGTPSLSQLQAAAAQAREAGADVFKAATTVETAGDLAVLFALLEAERGMRIAVMGMGRLGRASRPALAAAGSEFNYGYLGAAAQVPGQWPVADLRARIDEVCAATTARTDS